MGQFDYNNLNYLVAGQLVEQVTGESLAAAVLTQDVIAPAELGRVWVQDAQQPEPPLTVADQDPDSDLDTVDDDEPWLPSRSIASSTGPAGASPQTHRASHAGATSSTGAMSSTPPSSSR